jgi:hypothetical protein
VGQFFKKLQKLIILDPAHICLFPIQEKFRVKLHEESESGPINFKKVYFQAQIGLFVVLTTMTSHTKTIWALEKYSKIIQNVFFSSKIVYFKRKILKTGYAYLFLEKKSILGHFWSK